MARCVLKTIASFLPTGTSHSIQKFNFVMPPKLVNSRFASHKPHIINNGTLYKKSLLTDVMNIRTFSTAPQFCHPQSKEVKTGVSKYERRKKSARSSVKEFTMKGKTGDHDMAIKLGKIQGLLDKGKTIVILVKHHSEQTTLYPTGVLWPAPCPAVLNTELENFGSGRNGKQVISPLCPYLEWHKSVTFLGVALAFGHNNIYCCLGGKPLSYKTTEQILPHKASFKDTDKSGNVSSQIEKKLKDNLQNVTKFRTDYSNEHTTKFTILPSNKAEEEKIISGNSNSNSKTSAS